MKCKKLNAIKSSSHSHDVTLSNNSAQSPLSYVPPYLKLKENSAFSRLYQQEDHSLYYQVKVERRWFSTLASFCIHVPQVFPMWLSPGLGLSLIHLTLLQSEDAITSCRKKTRIWSGTCSTWQSQEPKCLHSPFKYLEMSHNPPPWSEHCSLFSQAGIRMTGLRHTYVLSPPNWVSR